MMITHGGATSGTLGGATSDISTLGGGSDMVGVTSILCHLAKTLLSSETSWSCESALTLGASSRAHVRRRTACTILFLGVIVGWVRYECINSTVSEIDVAFFSE